MNEKISFFDEKFPEVDPVQRLLPFFHSCDSFIGHKILTSGRLKPSPCKVFVNEQLLYFFYGRPAYKNTDAKSFGLKSLLPMTFVFKADAIRSIKRMAPFDTGAFKLGLYNEYLHPGMKMEDFFLSPHKETLTRGVTFFYLYNQCYYDGEPRDPLQYNAADFEIESYHELIKNLHKNQVDDRKASFEVQSEEEIPLVKGCIEAVVMAKCFRNSPIEKKIIDLGADIIEYQDFKNIPADHYYALTLTVVRKYLEKMNYLNARSNSI